MAERNAMKKKGVTHFKALISCSEDIQVRCVLPLQNTVEYKVDHRNVGRDIVEVVGGFNGRKQLRLSCA